MKKPLPATAARHAFALLVAAAPLWPACTCTDVAEAPKAAPITAPFRDDFERKELGADWLATDPAVWRIEDDAVVGKGSHNHPLWLRRPIPRDAVVEFDVWSNDPAGDIKVEIWGDGHSQATDLQGQYTSSAYNFIFGGWRNTISTLARLNEHGADRKVRSDVRVEVGRKYHVRIARKGGHIDWQLDGKPFLDFDDPQPLEGDSHAYFAFADWEAELHFDNLSITPN